MASQIRSLLRHQLSRVPLVYPLSIRLTSRFKVERELIKGTHRNENLHKSILHFSVNKAATQYTKSILSRCAGEIGLTHVRIHEYAFYSDFSYLDHLSAEEMIQYRHIFKPAGYLYSVFGGMIAGFPNLQDYKVVLMIRDPRDVLTSSYFSVAYSHVPPTGRNKINPFMKERAFARQAGIDQYVLSKSEDVCRNYQRYLDLLVRNRPDVYVSKYEDMVSDFQTWLDRLLCYCELEISPTLKQELLQEAYRARPNEENVAQNKRQITPGDHERKLQPETINHLNSLLSPVLTAFKYEHAAAA